MEKLGLHIKQQVHLPVFYKGIKLEAGYRLDLLVEDLVIVEVKSVSSLEDIHLAQILTYLKLKELKVGLLINFNSTKLINGIKRVKNGY